MWSPESASLCHAYAVHSVCGTHLFLLYSPTEQQVPSVHSKASITRRRSKHRSDIRQIN